MSSLRLVTTNNKTRGKKFLEGQKMTSNGKCLDAAPVVFFSLLFNVGKGKKKNGEWIEREQEQERKKTNMERERESRREIERGKHFKDEKGQFSRS